MERNQHGPPYKNVLMELNFRKINYIFFIFIFILLIEGIIHHFYYIISNIFDFLVYQDQKGYNPVIWHENGFIENLQILLIFTTLVIFFLFFKKNYLKLNIFYRIIFLFYLIGLIYYFLEEVSWGQHFFKWQTPLYFIENNKQNETNFHNISNLFNQLPRNLLFIWCTISFLVIKIKYIQKNKFLSLFILPTNKLRIISYLILSISFPKLFIESLLNLSNLENNVTYDLITFKFIRFSEFQELLFNYYILIHCFYLKKNFLNIKKS